MADQVKINEDFLKFLEKTPEALAKVFDVLKEFYKLQGEVVSPDTGTVPAGPRVLNDEKPNLTTKELTNEELDKMSRDLGDAQVKEKALEWLKGFITGLMIIGG